MPNDFVRFLPAITWPRISRLAAVSGFLHVVLMMNGFRVLLEQEIGPWQGSCERGTYVCLSPSSVDDFILLRAGRGFRFDIIAECCQAGGRSPGIMTDEMRKSQRV
jgi:hypothetical protein